ncbi:HAD family phosphatase [Mucilaginibacter sp. Bleaf8]|uniref:HAD family hydrolase n=1 Tax=Mucilaginibacter sp. Bleaf8 TaxID=2834430 RepID=UPI001BD024D0|nr:HAD family phosphatase [Mucilaginibacter sp. Bleaf8]MBS7566560.1 HAD family phosphatase [Mucilaginibacter sp. Bleaf8]
MTNTIIFDLGGVLIDWNPHYLYDKIFTNPAERDHFLANICTSDWNEEQDAGRTISEGTELLVAQHPGQEENIRAFYGRWEEMLGGAIEGTVALFKQLKDSGRFKVYALTNWSTETFGIAQSKYDFLNWFDGIVVSGVEKTRKPYPEFYQILFDRYQVNPAEALFIDDNLRNIKAAEALGLPGIRFTSSQELEEQLIQKKLL